MDKNKPAPSGASAASPSPARDSLAGDGASTPAPEAKSSAARPKRARPSKSDRKDAKASEEKGRFHCDYCARDLSQAVRARCAVCPDYDACLDCFSVGAALFPHRADHPYRLIAVSQREVFQAGWSADEEEKMLEGLEMYGVGNWEEVAKMVASKNAEQTEAHFMKVFLQSKVAPLPDQTLLVPMDKTLTDEDGLSDFDPKALRVMHMHQQEDAAGWMAKRGDFVYEWDNEAEELLGDLEITAEDSRRERDLKLSVLEVYNHKLDERERRKDFVLLRNLTDVKASTAIEKKRSKEERELREKLRVFARFLSPSDLDKLIKGLLDERAMRTHLDGRRDARMQGANTVAEANRIAVNAAKEAKAAKTAAAAAAAKAAALKAAAEAAIEDRKGGEEARKSGGGSSHRGGNRRKSGGGGGKAAAAKERAAAKAAAKAAASSTAEEGNGSDSRATSVGGGFGIGVGNGGSGGSGAGGSGGGGEGKDRSFGRNAITGDIEYERMPGAELMSAAEISLCTSLKLTPHQYLIVKEVLVRESARVGHLKKKDAKLIVRLDPTKVSKIFDYLSLCGWIRANANTANGAARNAGVMAGGVVKR